MITRALIDSVRKLRYDVLPEEAREAGRQCLLDFLGCALAGAAEPSVEILVATVVRSEGSREAALIGRRERASRLTAALVNGTAGHALDFDDTHTAMNGHPSVPVLPALLALADTEDADGRRFLTALVAGIELECRLGALLGGGTTRSASIRPVPWALSARLRPVPISSAWTRPAGSARSASRAAKRRG